MDLSQAIALKYVQLRIMIFFPIHLETKILE